MFRYFADFSISYPIDEGKIDKDLFPEFVEYDPSQPLMNSTTRPTYLAQYIDRWIEGGVIPRRLARGVPRKPLYELRGIRPV